MRRGRGGAVGGGRSATRSGGASEDPWSHGGLLRSDGDVHGFRPSVRPTSRGVLAAVLGVAALVAGLLLAYPGLVVLGVGLLVLCVLAVVSVALPAALVPQRRVSPLRVVRNGPCVGVLRVTSMGRWGVSLDADEFVGGRRVHVAVPRLSAGAEVEVEYPIPTVQRGVVEVGPLRLRRVGVAGLAVAQGVLGDVLGVHVLPRVLPVLGLPKGVRRGHVGADERVERGGTDLMSLREYIPGDDLRRVHWATSARSGMLMVREDADPARPYLTVLLDDRAESYADDQFEDAVEVAASLIAGVVEAGHPIRLIGISGRLDVDIPAAPPGMVADGADELLAALAAIKASEKIDVPATVSVRDLDVVVVATGPHADLDPLVAEAARAPLGVTCVVDPVRSRVDARGSVLVLRGPRAEDILHSWDEVVAG